MPIAVYMLGLLIFAMTTSEFMVGGMMPELAKEFGVSISDIGYLISIYAIGMVIGGPMVTIGLLKVSKKKALMTIAIFFLIGQIVGSIATSYEVMMVARIITGIASAAGFAVSIAFCVHLVEPQIRGRAASIVLGGLMIATVIGLPMSTMISQYFGWRTSFWVVVGLVLLSGLMVQWLVPTLPKTESGSIRSEFTAFKNSQLWAAFATSGLIIAATFAAFSYFTPIFTELTGFSASVVPMIMAVYGGATVIGNMITGRLADKFTMQTLFIGLVLLTVSLLMFALFASNPIITIMSVIVLGLVGVPMNPAMATRVMKTSNTGTLVNAIHGSIISLGVGIGSSIGALTMDAGFGLISTLWVGFILAVLGVISLLPFTRETFRKKTRSLNENHMNKGKSCVT
ncbi:MFS transporter [Shimazuella kribbensis]|uniref:MFS transporter n=1 Tax=Shimazuella kribbensis TaxID=139808 RepID=UPI00042459B1|nr:MFS transporter [Shimazuella kribbensis]